MAKKEQALKSFRVRGHILHKHPHIGENHPAANPDNKGVSRENIVEDVMAIDEKDAIKKCKEICAKKYNLVRDAKWFNYDGEEKGESFKVD